MITIYRPVQTNHIGQKFGESKACAQWNLQTNRPVFPYKIVNKQGSVCPVGYKSFYENVLGQPGHNGFDLTAFKSEPIYFNVIADTDWVVHQVNDDPGYGLYVEIRSTKPVLNDKHVKSIYVHALKNLVKEGDMITPGQYIQDADSTGASSGHHVHMGWKYCDENGNTLEKTNGYGGYQDPAPYYTNQFILDFLGLKQKLSYNLQLLQALLQLQLLLLKLKQKVGSALGGLLS